MNKGRGYLWEPKGIEIRKGYKGGFLFFSRYFISSAGCLHHFENLPEFLKRSKYLFFSTLSLLLASACILGRRRNSPRMAKMIMKKRSSERMSMKGGRDWKIWRRLLGRQTGPGGVRRSRGRARAPGVLAGTPQWGTCLSRWRSGAPDPQNTKSPLALACDIMLSDFLGLPLSG